MSISEIVLIGIALSMDAFAVCIIKFNGLYEYDKAEKTFNADYVRAFSGIMPILGFFLGSLFRIFY